MGAHDVDCSELFDQLDLYLDGELPPGRLEELREHLAVCFPCADRVTFEQQLQAIVRDRCATTAPTTLVQRIRVHLSTATGG